MKSIIQHEKRCFFCGSERDLEIHHCLHGTANRKLADEDGLTIYLCKYHHTGQDGVHHRADFDLTVKKVAETEWLEHYHKTIDDFIKRYGKNYL